MVGLLRSSQIPQIRRHRRKVSLFFALGQFWDRDRRQNPNDHRHDEHFDECKASVIGVHSTPSQCLADQQVIQNSNVARPGPEELPARLRCSRPRHDMLTPDVASCSLITW